MTAMVGEGLNGEWLDDERDDVIEPVLVYVDDAHHGNTMGKLNTLRRGRSSLFIHSFVGAGV